MRYLLDTNIFIYAAIDRDSLSRDVKVILEDYDNSSANSPSTSEIDPQRKNLVATLTSRNKVNWFILSYY